MRRSYLVLVGIVVLALVLRFYNLASNPPATYGDEISFAWNAWSILKTGTDEWGVKFPIQFRAFDDYKSPIPVYILVPLFAVFGMNTLILRMPVALFGTGTVLIAYLLIKKLILNEGKNKFAKQAEPIALLVAFLLAVSPWHVHLSRGYFESTIAMFFFMLALYLFVKAKEKSQYLVWSAVAFVATLYTYFTPRLMLLLFIPFLFWWAKDWVSKFKKQVLLFWLVFILLSLPLIKVSFLDQGLSRMSKLTSARTQQIEKEVIDNRNSVNSPEVIKKILHNKPLYWLRAVLNDYIEHFSINFLYLYGDSSIRYGLGNMGMLYVIELPFMLVGLFVAWQRFRSVFWLLVVWGLLAPIPTALVGKPFAVRSLVLVIVPLVFSAIGMIALFEQLAHYRIRTLLVGFLIVGYSLSVGYYAVRLYLEYPSYAATWWGWENKAAIDLAVKEQHNYDHVFISNFYSGAELAYAYYTQMDPYTYRKAKADTIMLADGREQIQFGNIYIGSLDIDEKRLTNGILPPKTLYIGRPEEPNSAESIKDPGDGRVLFHIYRTN